MGLATDLGYSFERPNALQRLMQAFGSSRPGAWVFSKLLRHLDDGVSRLTGGRHSVPGLLAGLPVIDLTTTGRKSRQQRRSHLISIPVGDTLAVLGTNFGQANTPAWVLNLEADPQSSVTFRGVTRSVVARPASGEEEAAVMALSAGIYGGYAKYRTRISGRRVRVFVLEPD